MTEGIIHTLRATHIRVLGVHVVIRSGTRELKHSLAPLIAGAIRTMLGEQKPANAKETAKEATPDGWREERQKLLDACREYQETVEHQRKVIEGFLRARATFMTYSYGKDGEKPTEGAIWSQAMLDNAYEFHKANGHKT